jgi:hypothetical protein
VGSRGFRSPQDEELKVTATDTPATALHEQELASLA